MDPMFLQSFLQGALVVQWIDYNTNNKKIYIIMLFWCRIPVPDFSCLEFSKVQLPTTCSFNSRPMLPEPSGFTSKVYYRQVIRPAPQAPL